MIANSFDFIKRLMIKNSIGLSFFIFKMILACYFVQYRHQRSLFSIFQTEILPITIVVYKNGENEKIKFFQV